MAVLQMIPPVGTDAFLAAAGWPDAAVSPLAGDASFRRYFRVSDGDRRAVLMDAPPPQEDPRPFIAIAGYLRSHGFRAPAVLAADAAAGLVLIEDFGDRLMRAEVDRAADGGAAVYRAAIDILVRLHDLPPADVPPYDLTVYHREAALLTEWTVPALCIAADLPGYADAWDAALTPVLDAGPMVTVLRDYHSENIMLLDDGALGLLDFQDALAGHPAYDLVSLLQDARRDVPVAMETAMLDHYCRATGAGDDFRAAYALLGAQRNAKIIGIFTRLAHRDGKPRYLELIPRMWALLERDLAHPALAPVATWFDANIPPAHRVAPA